MNNPLGVSPSKGIREPHEVKKKSFDLGGNRTHDLRIRSTVTLPTELSRQSNGRSNPEVVGSIPTEVKRLHYSLELFALQLLSRPYSFRGFPLQQRRGFRIYFYIPHF